MTADPIPVLCVLIRHHKGDHDEELLHAVPERRRCGAVVRMIEPEASLLTEEDAAADALDFAAGPEDFRGSDDGAFPDDIRQTLRADPEEAERLGSEGEPVASAVAGESAPIVYPMLDTALLSALRDSLVGLSFSGILAKFPGADPATVSEALAALFQEGKVSRIMGDRLMSDDEPPQPMYAATFAMPDPSPASPSPADLTAAVVDATESLVSAQEAARQAASVAKAIEGCLVRAIDAKARSLLKGGLCAIGGVTYRAKPPRKAKGAAEADPAALWTLERVEVGE